MGYSRDYLSHSGEKGNLNMKKESEKKDSLYRIQDQVNESLRNEIVNAVDSLIDYIKILEDSRDSINDTLNKVDEDAKIYADRKLIEENKQLKEKLDLCYCGYMFDSKKEVEAFKAFEQKHIHNRKTRKMEGGKMPYVISYGHGLGCCKTAVCQICGEKEDITDTGVW